MPFMHRLTPTLLACAASLCAQGDGVPTAEELDKAQANVVRVMAERLTQAIGGDISNGSSLVLAAAFDAEDRATKYLLWRQAVEMAERTGNAWLAMQHDRALAPDFALDPTQSGVNLLKRMAKANDDPKHVASIAMAAMAKASEHSLADDTTAMLSFYDVAVRAALRTEHAPLYAHVRDRLATLRAPAKLAPQLAGSLHDSPWRAELVVSGLLSGEVRMLEPFTLRELAPLFRDLDGFDAATDAGELDSKQLVTLADRARNPQMRTGMLRCAMQRLVRGYLVADEAERRRTAEQIVTLCERLCRADGLTRLRFDRDEKRTQLAFANGDWRVENGQLVGAAKGNNNFATHRARFLAMNAVVIRGGIRSKQGLNFRCKAGDVNLLLNWEMEDQNHLWQNGACHRTEPRVLEQGREHTILIFSDGASTHVCIDGEHLYTVPGMLAGTVSVYPSLGSEIFVREILVDGVPDGLVDAPIGVMM